MKDQSTRLADQVNTHSYPAVVRQHPHLLRLIHFVTQALTLRVWYVNRALRTVLTSTPIPFTYVDAGCGGGDFLLPYARQYPSCTFIGVDRAEENVAMCRLYQQEAGLLNLQMHNAHLESWREDIQADVVSCIAVLQYTTDDAGVLRHLRSVLKDTGRLVLYVPVNGDTFLPFYPRLARRFGVEDYEVRQTRQRMYTEEEVLDKLGAAGFALESITRSYGAAGKAYHELYTLFLAWILQGRGVRAAVPALGLILLYPLLLLLMAIDYTQPNRHGNGLLVIARRKLDG